MLRPAHASFSVAVCAALLVIAGANYGAQSVGSAAIASRADVVVFGATPAGIAGAVSAARAGRRVVLVEPGSWMGGMMSGGLSNTDTGPRGPEVISGLAGEFFRRVRAIEETRGACLDPCASSFLFEPQVAEQVFEAMLREAGVAVERSAHLVGVEKNGATIARLRTSRGDVNGDVFIDASYEGDLMSLAGVPFQVGREPRRPSTQSGTVVPSDQEDNAGVQQRQLPLGLHLDPYRVPGDAASGLIAFVEPRPDPLPEAGDGDARVTAYTYRLCVTDDPANRIPFTRPERYAASDYELHARLAAAVRPDQDIVRSMFNPARIARSRDRNYFKYDLNSSLTLSTDLTGDGLNQGYVDAPQSRREQIQRTYRDYIQGLLYAMQTEPRFKALHERVSRFGYCADEFAGNGGWPHQFYIRVGRRMVGQYVMNENDVMQNGRRPRIPDPVAFGTYSLAAHHHRYLAAPAEWPDGQRKDAVMLEGLLIGRLPNDEPYPISYRALTPFETDARNLLNPVTLSATHVAYSSIRMEPTFMMLGEAAGIAAALSVESKASVQSLNYPSLRRRLVDAGLRLD
jgi:FAD dependent oxidoreductase